MNGVENIFGCIPSNKDVRDYKLNTKVISMTNLPRTYRINTIRVKSQGDKPTCTAHAAAEIVEYFNRKQEGRYIKFSTDFVYGLRNQYTDYRGEGMQIRDALKVLQDYGDVPFSDLPTNSENAIAEQYVNNKIEFLKDTAYKNRISNYYRINTINELKYSLVNNGPVIVGMWWPDDASLSPSGVFIHGTIAQDSAHAVVVIGYDSHHWIVQNSWGTKWGIKGTFKVLFEDTNELFFDIYGITDNIIEVKTPNKITKYFGKIVNQIVNFNLKN